MRWLQPLLRQPLRWLLAGLLAIIAFALLPALFRHENALQIRVTHQGVTLPDGFYVWQQLNALGIPVKSITPAQDSLVLRFESEEQSQAAQQALHKILPYGFEIARLENNGSSGWLNKISLRQQSVG
ncbi:EnvZ/OmpR regulon moderator MzrA [Mixta tenebrionis]|mgnify:CR=1 FL=1|uniref:Modulator protein MzrA n=1 Tax=Mixta tenebrionis TaxID=2562439 RepID=A0A506V5S2_9GAMM|nr:MULTISPECIES: EnvZ/OmpR regulon moderator MzrA [Mixta]QHM78080.1 Modulator protein MzrA [Mixta theicola]TPW41045.1 EnvZ/OmpR regulon moderator MzrA [Mixta tenebrionis]